MRRVNRAGFVMLSSLMAILALVACSEEAPGPQFANEPAPTREATAALAIASPMRQTATPAAVATPTSIGDLLSVRGAPDVVYAASESTVWMIETNGDAKRLYQPPKGTRILAIDPGPSSLDVAVLTETISGARQRVDLGILSREGEVLHRISEFGDAEATPTPSSGHGVNLVNWSPQGDHLLVSLGDGRLFDVALDDRVSPLQIGHGEEVVQPTWSPTGESIAFISSSTNSRTRNLGLYDVASGVESTIVDATNGRFVVDFAWMPDGISLLFTEGGELAGAVSGIDLWRIRVDGTDRSLMASAGTVAPVARITTMRPSPDGRSVAYAVLVPGEDDPIVDSVWVRDITSGTGYRIPLPTVSSIDDIVWTNQGLVVLVTAGGPGRGRPEMLAILLVNREGEAEVLWAAPVVEGTPASASPVAPPAAR